MNAPTLTWLAAVAGELDPAATVEMERLQRVIELATTGPDDPVDQAGRLLWAIPMIRPLPAGNAQLGVIAADLHLAANGLALVTDQVPALRKLLDNIAHRAVDIDEAVGWIRDHVETRERSHRMFERFTDRARQVLSLANDEAALLDHGFIGTEHLLLAMLAEGTGVAAVVLADLGLTLEATRAAVREIIGPHAGHHEGGAPPYTPRVKKVLELSLREALSLQHNYIGTEHLLLGLAHEGEGIGARVIQDAVGSANALELLRRKVTTILEAQFPTPPQTATSTLSAAEEARLAQTILDGRTAEPGTDRRRAADKARAALLNVLADRVYEVVGSDMTYEISSDAVRRGNEALRAAIKSWDPGTSALDDHVRPLIEEAVAEARARGANRNLVKCSFCGKSQHQVKKLIAGPQVYICDECIDLCNDIITEELVATTGVEPQSHVKEVPPPDPEHPRCTRCQQDLATNSRVDVITIGDDHIRVWTCNQCRTVIGIVP